MMLPPTTTARRRRRRARSSVLRARRRGAFSPTAWPAGAAGACCCSTRRGNSGSGARSGRSLVPAVARCCPPRTGRSAHCSTLAPAVRQSYCFSTHSCRCAASIAGNHFLTHACARPLPRRPAAIPSLADGTAAGGPGGLAAQGAGGLEGAPENWSSTMVRVGGYAAGAPVRGHTNPARACTLRAPHPHLDTAALPSKNAPRHPSAPAGARVRGDGQRDQRRHPRRGGQDERAPRGARGARAVSGGGGGRGCGCGRCGVV
jgi:hypothetical protein